jgi:hypothetical protein
MIPRVFRGYLLLRGSSSETPLLEPPLEFPVLVWVLRWWFGPSGGFQLFFNWSTDFSGRAERSVPLPILNGLGRF